MQDRIEKPESSSVIGDDPDTFMPRNLGNRGYSLPEFSYDLQIAAPESNTAPPGPIRI